MQFYKLALGSMAVASAISQTRVDLRTQAKSVDFSGASSTKPSQMGTALPATCSVGQTFFNTAATAGQNLYACTAANVWTQQGGGGGGAVTSVFSRTGAVTAQSGDYSAAQISGLAPSATTDTTNAANITSGTLGAARLPNPGVATLGGVQSKDCSAGGQFLQKINTDGTATCATPSASGPALVTGAGYPHANCTTGDFFTQTDAISGQSVWVCGPNNIWTNQATSLISSGVPVSTSGRVWTFDMTTPGSGTSLTDLSSAGHNGTFGCSGYSNPTWSATGLVFAAAQCVSAPFTSAAGWTVCYTTGNPSAVQATLVAATNNNSWLVLTQWDGTPRWSSYGNPNVKLAQNPGGNHCLSAVYGASASTTHLYWDGVESTYAANLGNAVTSDATVGIGGLPGFGGYGYTGTIYYATAYSAAPSAATIKADVASIAYTLSTRGVFLNNTNLPVSVVGLGDSIMDGFTADEPLHAIAGHIPTASFLELGVPGTMESSIAARFPGLLLASSYSGAGKQLVAIDQGGTNDICNLTGQAAATLAARKSVASGVHAVGGKVLWISILPRSGCGNGSFAVDRTTLNSSMASGWIGFADGYAGFEADPVIGTGAIYTTNTACSTDGVHPSNGFCNNLYIQYIEDGLRPLLGLPFPRLLASATVTAQTSSIGTTSLATSPAPGNYRIWATLVPTIAATSGSGCSITFTLGWTDPNGAKTSISSAVSLTTLNSGAFVTTPALISSGNITYSTALTSGTCTGEQYQLYVRADSF